MPSRAGHGESSSPLAATPRSRRSPSTALAAPSPSRRGTAYRREAGSSRSAASRAMTGRPRPAPSRVSFSPSMRSILRPMSTSPSTAPARSRDSFATSRRSLHRRRASPSISISTATAAMTRWGILTSTSRLHSPTPRGGMRSATFCPGPTRCGSQPSPSADTWHRSSGM